jgi:hypothetical protein
LENIERELAVLRRQTYSTRSDNVMGVTPGFDLLAPNDVGIRTTGTYYRMGSWGMGYVNGDVMEMLAIVQIGGITVNGLFQFRVQDQTGGFFTESISFSTATFGASFRAVRLRWRHPWKVNEFDGRLQPSGAGDRLFPAGDTFLEYRVRRTSGTFNLQCYVPHAVRFGSNEQLTGASANGAWTVT